MGCKESENVNFSDTFYEAKMTTFVFNLTKCVEKCKINLDIKRIE